MKNRSGRAQSAFLFCALALLLFTGAGGGARLSAQDASPWHLPAWTYRYRVRVEEPRLTPASQVAWAKFRVPASSHPKGWDVRVVDSQGQMRRTKLQYFQPALYGIVVFELRPGDTRYHLYLGNPAASASPVPWEPRAGVFLETRQLKTARIDNWNMFRQALSLSTYSFGASFQKNIHHGYNQFGDPDRFISLYTAYLQVPATGKYTFCTVSDDASFMLIDGKEICKWPGRHTVGSRIIPRQTGVVNLAGGVHKMEYYHADFGDSQAAIAGWRPPNRQSFQVISPRYFAPIRAGYAFELEKRGAALTADFRAVQKDWLKAAGHVYTLYDFNDYSGVKSGKIVSQEWTFSDGTHFTGSSFSKMFFHTGDFLVTLAVKDSQGRSDSLTRRFRVHPQDKMEKASQSAVQTRIIYSLRQEHLTGLNRNDLQVAADLLSQSQDLDHTSRFLQWIIEQRWEKNKEVEEGLLTQFIDLTLKESYTKTAEAERFAQDYIARLPEGSKSKSEIYHALGSLQLYRIKDPGKALLSFKSALLSLPPSGASRQRLERKIRIAMGDAYRSLAKPDEAMDAYRKAQALPPPGKTKDFDISSFALTAEAYIRRGELDEAQTILERWQSLYPLERLTGYASVLQAKVYAARHDYARGIQELDTYLNCGGRGVFALMALELLGDLQIKVRNRPTARKTYQRILNQFQDEEVRTRVKRKMIGL